MPDTQWLRIASCTADRPLARRSPPGARRELVKLTTAGLLSSALYAVALTPGLETPARSTTLASRNVVVERTLLTADVHASALPADLRIPWQVRHKPRQLAAPRAPRIAPRTAGAAAFTTVSAPPRRGLGSSLARLFVGSGQYRARPFPLPSGHDD